MRSTHFGVEIRFSLIVDVLTAIASSFVFSKNAKCNKYFRLFRLFLFSFIRCCWAQMFGGVYCVYVNRMSPGTSWGNCTSHERNGRRREINALILFNEIFFRREVFGCCGRVDVHVPAIGCDTFIVQWQHPIHQRIFSTATSNLWLKLSAETFCWPIKMSSPKNDNDDDDDDSPKLSFHFARSLSSAGYMRNFHKSRKPTKKLIDYDIKCFALSNNNG